MKGKTHSKSSIEKMSGRNNPMFGKPVTDDVKEKIRQKMMEAKNPFHGKKHTNENHIKNVMLNSGINHPNFGKCPSEETKLKLRLARIKWLEKNGFVENNGKSFNKNGCNYLDKLSVDMGWNIEHALNGGEYKISGYFVDGHDKERNIVVEYDERHHYDGFGNLRQKDVERMNRIIKESNCKFYRYNESNGSLKCYTD